MNRVDVWLVVAAVAIAIVSATGRRTPKRRPTTDRQAATVAARIARASETAGLPIRLAGAVTVTADGDGREWPVTLTGKTTIDDARDRAEAFASALNEPYPIAATLEFRAGRHPGTATLSVYKSDPLLRTVELRADTPGRPTTIQTPCIFSRGADGRTHRYRLLNSSGGIHGGLFGQTRSGKSAGLSVILEQLAWCPDVLLVGIEMSPKLGADMRQLRNRYDSITTLRDGWPACLAKLDQIDRYMTARAGQVVDAGHTKIVAFTPARPFVVLVIDEVHRLFQDDDRSGDMLVALAKTHAAMGLSIQAATQYPTADALPGPFRTQLTSRVAWRLDNAQETNMAMAGRWGERTPGPHTIQGATSEDDVNPYAGQCYSSLDGGSKIRQRTLWAPPALLAATNKATAHLRLTMKGTS